MTVNDETHALGFIRQHGWEWFSRELLHGRLEPRAIISHDPAPRDPNDDDDDTTRMQGATPKPEDERDPAAVRDPTMTNKRKGSPYVDNPMTGRTLQSIPVGGHLETAKMLGSQYK